MTQSKSAQGIVNNRLLLILAMMVCLASISSASILIRFALESGVTPILIAAFRMGIAFVALSVASARKRSWKEYAKLDTRSVILLAASGILLALHLATWMSSLSRTSILSSVVLVSTSPIWIGLLSPIVLRESPSTGSWLGIFIAILGCAMLGLSDSNGAVGNAGWGDLLALCGAVFASGYLIIGRTLRATISLSGYVWLVYGVSAVCLTAWAVLANQTLTGLAAQAFFWLILVALIPQLVGHTVANFLVRRLPATVVSVFLLGESVGSALLALVIFDEVPGPFQMAGGIIVLLGIAVSVLVWPRLDQRSTSGETFV